MRINRYTPQGNGLFAAWLTRPTPTNLIHDPAGGYDGNGGLTAMTFPVDPVRQIVMGFDGAASVVVIQNSAVGSTSFDTSYITLAAWIKTTMSGVGNIIDRDGNGSNGEGRAFQFRISSGQINFIPFYSGGGNGSHTATPTVNDGAWHHVAVTMDGARVKIYIDGGKQYDQADAHTLALVSCRVMIGRHVEANQWFNGRIDDARYYKRALDDSIIWQMFAADSRYELYTLPQHSWDFGGGAAANLARSWGQVIG